MTAKEKSKQRSIFFWVSVSYILLMTTVLFIFQILDYKVNDFLPIFANTTAFLGSLGITNYLTTPKDT